MTTAYTRNRTLVVFTTALVLCFVILFITQNWLQSALLKEKEEQAMANLRLIHASVDASFDHIQKLGQLILMDTSIARFIYQGIMPSGSEEIQTVIDAISLLPTSTSINSLLSEIYVYSNRSGYILSSRNAFLDPERMYPTLFAVDDLNYPQFKNKYLTSPFWLKYFPLTNARIQGRVRPVIPYAQTFPLNSPATNAGKVLFLIDATSIIQLLKDQKSSGGLVTYIIDQNNEVIVSTQNEALPVDSTYPDGQHRIDIRNKEYILSITTSSVTGLRFFSLLPISEVRAMLNPLWIVASIASVIVFLLFALISFIMLLRSHRKWNEVLGLAGKALPYEDAIKYISSIVEDDRNKTREAGFAPFITDTFFRRLIHGRMTSPAEIKVMLNQIQKDISFDDTYTYQMLNITIHDAQELLSTKQYKEIDFTRIVAGKHAQRAFAVHHYLYMDMAFTLWILIWHPDGRHLERQVDAFWGEFSSSVPTTTSLAVSSQKTTLVQIFSLANECLEVQPTLASGAMRRYKDLQIDHEPYHFGRDEERLLIQGILKGEREPLEELLTKIEHTNFTERNLAPQERGNLLKDLYASAIKVSKLLKLPFYQSPFETLEEAKHFFLAQAQRVNTTRRDADDLLANQIETYIGEMYCDPAFNLSHMANHFGLKESYLYHFMLSRMESSFAQYLESYRLDRSLSLFQEAQLTIAQIARSCGYANPQTFRRAFFKQYEILPSDHQKLVLAAKE